MDTRLVSPNNNKKSVSDMPRAIIGSRGSPPTTKQTTETRLALRDVVTQTRRSRVLCGASLRKRTRSIASSSDSFAPTVTPALWNIAERVFSAHPTFLPFRSLAKNPDGLSRWTTALPCAAAPVCRSLTTSISTLLETEPYRYRNSDEVRQSMSSTESHDFERQM